jgi:hypothetical protein
MIAVILTILLVLATFITYWLAWWVLLAHAFTFTSWGALGLAVAIYGVNRILGLLLDTFIEGLK